MQLNEIREKVANVDQIIDRAARACRGDPSVPDTLRQRVRQLDQDSDQAQQLLRGESDEARVRECVDGLEASGDRAKQACEQAGSVNQELRDALLMAHSELSSLKHQLH